MDGTVKECECGNPLEEGDGEYCQECQADADYWAADDFGRRDENE